MLALRELALVRRENEREMREARQPCAQSLVEQNLLVRVRQMVLAANHVRDVHLYIVEDDRQVGGGRPAGARKKRCFVLKKAPLGGPRAAILKMLLPFARFLKTKGEGSPRR